MAERIPFWDYPSFRRCLVSWIDANADNTICVTGYEGSGKSELAIQLAWDIAEATRTDFELTEHVLFDFEDFMRAFTEYEKQILVIDEAGTLLFSRDHQSKESKLIVKTLQADRFKNNTRFFVLPDMNWLDVYTRQHRVRIWIDVKAIWTLNGIIRGTASVHWKMRRWDIRNQEWNYFWTPVFDIEFSKIPDQPAIKAYGELKKAKAFNNVLGNL